ncbi:MAG: hypothetical protein Q4A60_09320 [Pasteurellaceae bacterium]|nr:hypothetical protein [Pasteurellaceae bacterium]
MQVVLNGKQIGFNQQSYHCSSGMTPLFLILLYEQSLLGQSLSLVQFQAELKKYKPCIKLQRTQLIRIIDDLEHAVQRLQLPFTLYYAHRKKSAGSWTLIAQQDFQLQYSKPTTEDYLTLSPPIHHLFNQSYKAHKQYVLLLSDFLSKWILSHSLCDSGYLKEALIELKKCYQFPITPFTKALLDLNQARLLIHTEKYAQAEQIIEDILSRHQLCEHSHISAFSRILLSYIQYHKPKPIHNILDIIKSFDKPPKYPQEDSYALMEWHNLRALWLKKLLLHIEDSKHRLTIHVAILAHLQEAIILSLILENKNKFLDFCLNYALYLQTVIPFNLSDTKSVIKWYELCYLHATKFNIGDYSALDKIFFAEFYLNNQKEIDFNGITLELPNSESYYEEIINKINVQGNLKQKILYSFCYFNFLKMQDSPNVIKIQATIDDIMADLDQNKDILKKLKEDGYAEIITEIYEYENNPHQASKQASKHNYILVDFKNYKQLYKIPFSVQQVLVKSGKIADSVKKIAEKRKRKL